MGPPETYPPLPTGPESLAPEERQAFEELRLTPGNWAVLFALPVVKASWDRWPDPLPPLTRLGWPFSPRPRPPMTREQLRWSLLKLSQELLPNHLLPARREQSLKLLGSLLPPEPAEAGLPADPPADLERGLRVLCWALAKYFAEPQERREVLDQVRGHGRALLERSSARWTLDRVLDAELPPYVDGYLPLTAFPGDAAPEVPPAELNGPDLSALWVVPIARLLQERYPNAEELSDVAAAVLGGGQAIIPGRLRLVFAPEWHRLLCTLLAPDCPAADREILFRDREAELAESLAKLAYGDRRRALEWVRQRALSIRDPEWELPEELIAAALRRVADEAERRRYHAPPVAAIPVATAITRAAAVAVQIRRHAEAVPSVPVVQVVEKLPPEVRPLPEVDPAAETGPWPPEARKAETLPFVSWQQALAEAREVDVTEAARLLRQQLLFTDGAVREGRVAVIDRQEDVPNCLWFVGDLHGDLLALASAWRFISSRQGKGPAHVLFLGDFVDRGPYSHETLLYLARLIGENGGRIGVLAGNHDEDFCWDAQAGRFRSGVEPAEYAAELNRSLEGKGDGGRVALGRAASEFFKRCLRAVFLPDGLLLAHGGFPHTDLLDSLRTRADLSTPQALQDFTWLRASANSPRKRPNRGTRGCEFGYEDFGRFSRHARERLDLPVRRLLRGHDHVPDRYACYPRYRANPVITINTMCRRLEDELIPEQFPLACIAEYVPGELPIVYRLPIERREIERAYFHQTGPG